MLRRPTKQYLYTLIWKHQSLFRTTAGFLCLFITYLFNFLFTLCLIPYLISECACVLLQCSYKFCSGLQCNQRLAVSWFIHSIHCGSSVFSYQGLESRPAQGDLAGLHNIETRRHWACALFTPVHFVLAGSLRTKVFTLLAFCVRSTQKETGPNIWSLPAPRNDCSNYVL
jgi:hypothetical protein